MATTLILVTIPRSVSLGRAGVRTGQQCCQLYRLCPFVNLIYTASKGIEAYGGGDLWRTTRF